MKTSRSGALLLVVVISAIVLIGYVAVSGRPTTGSAPRVGLMHVGTDHRPPSLATLVAGLEEFGWFDESADELVADLVEQGSVRQPKVELLWSNLEPGQAERQAAVFVHDRVNVIVAFEDSSIQAAQRATATDGTRIPVVFLHPSDPVGAGLVETLSHPGANLTGVFGARDPVAKQLELYHQIMPGLRRLLTLVDPDDAATPPLMVQAREAADQLGIELDVRDASTEADLATAFHSLAPGEVGGAFLLSPSLRLHFSQATMDLALQAGLPVQAHRKEWLDKGALFSLGVDVGPVGRAGARFVDSILTGTAPADLPVEQVPEIEFAINMRRAAELGIEVPEAVLELADVVYR